MEEHKPSLAEIQEKPWKYLGYKQFSSFVASDDDFFVVRRFGTLNARVILAIQDEILELEQKLNMIDEECSDIHHQDINNGSFREDPRQDRRDIITKLRSSLLEYNKFFTYYSELKGRPPASQQEVANVENWLFARPGIISQPEVEYIKHTDDLISIVTKNKTPLRRALERSKTFQLSKIFQTPPPPGCCDPENIRYISDQRIEAFVTIVVTSCGYMVLIAPIWILEVVDLPNTKLIIITAFTALFLAMLSSASVAKPFETLAGTAAYAAVLMVFIQTSNNN